MIMTRLPLTNISDSDAHHSHHYIVHDCMDGSLPRVMPNEEGEPVVLVALNARQVDDLTRLGNADLFTNSDLLVHMARRFDYLKDEGLMDSEQTYKGTGTVTVEFKVEVEVEATSMTGATVAMKRKLEDDWEQFVLDSVGGPHGDRIKDQWFSRKLVEADIKASLKE